MSMLDIIIFIRELDALGVIVQVEDDEHLAEALREILPDEGSELAERL